MGSIFRDAKNYELLLFTTLFNAICLPLKMVTIGCAHAVLTLDCAPHITLGSSRV